MTIPKQKNITDILYKGWFLLLSSYLFMKFWGECASMKKVGIKSRLSQC